MLDRRGLRKTMSPAQLQALARGERHHRAEEGLPPSSVDVRTEVPQEVSIGGGAQAVREGVAMRRRVRAKSEVGDGRVSPTWGARGESPKAKRGPVSREVKARGGGPRLDRRSRYAQQLSRDCATSWSRR